MRGDYHGQRTKGSSRKHTKNGILIIAIKDGKIVDVSVSRTNTWSEIEPYYNKVKACKIEGKA